MKYKDYYQTLGVERTAGADAIKKAYRKLAQKYHPDVTKDPEGEAKFKEIAEAWDTLKDPERRAAYDQLGQQRPGQDFRPPPGWETRFGDAQGSFDDIDLADLFAGLRGAAGRGARGGMGGMGGMGGGAGAGGHGMAFPGEDFEVAAHISLDDAFNGALIDLKLSVPEIDAGGRVRRVQRDFKARIPRGATDGQRLRLAGQGGKGINGGPDGDLFLTIVLHPHPLFRVDGHDLYIDLPLSPWEAVLGTTVKVPTPAGAVEMKIPAGTSAGRKLRLSKRGLPRPNGEAGDLFALVQIVVPTVLSERERELFGELAGGSTFDPRGHFEQEIRS